MQHMDNPPLHGVRVLELATGIAGPYAGRLLTMLGATVAKVQPPAGDPARRASVDDRPCEGLSPLYIHLNACKHLVSTPHDEQQLYDLVSSVDIVLDDRLRTELTASRLLEIAHATGALVVSLTPFGVDGGLVSRIEHDVLVQARSGLIGIQGDPGSDPLRLPGWQAQYQAGATGAVGALAALRLPGAQHLDVSWLAALLTANELHLADGIVSGVRRRSVGPFPTTAFPGGALPCSDGFVVPGSFREIDWQVQAALYGMPELLDDERFASRSSRAVNRDELWALIRPWYAQQTKQEIFDLALETPWTVGKVISGTEALTDPHLAARGFLGPVHTPGGVQTVPLRPFRGPGLPVQPQRIADAPIDGQEFDESAIDGKRTAIERPPLSGLRLLEVTTAWAGPFVGNLLGSLGMDVVKFEGLPPFDGYRVMRLHPDSEPAHWHHFHEDNRWFEVSAVHNAVNRNKRGAVMNLANPSGREVFLELARNADVVLCNFTASVLPQLGIGFDDLVAVNPRIIVVRMPAFGTEGPYSHAAGYGTVVEGMGGFGARFGYEQEGARISDLYWPDPVAGIHAALAVMTGIERRDRTGAGCEFDVSHMEAMWCALGEGIVAASQNGVDLKRMGNIEPGMTRSGFVKGADGRFVAFVLADTEKGASVDSLVAGSLDVEASALADQLRAAGAQAEVVLEVPDVLADPRLAERFEVVVHPVTGPIRHIRSPFVIDGVPTTTHRHAPLFDQDTDTLLTEAGIPSERVGELRAQGVVGGTLPAPAVYGL